MEKKTTKKTAKPAAKKIAKPHRKEEKKEEIIVAQAAPEINKEIIAESAEISASEIKEKKAKKYYEAVGRRKNAIARVRLSTIKPFEGDEGKITVNGKDYREYFPGLNLKQNVESPLRRLKSLNRFEVIAKTNGGGINGQAEAVRHGISRTLVEFNADFRKKLKKAGFLKRDPRVKERRKFGLKKARRAPQWAKR
ncbi:MAG: 30S ribosomal protein S9 [Parcubacteria group bacterium GW2011_GWA1_42_7]|nr:MAG: 30S ribosomal protein S9 [Parcubacteria group bacterium GW2011_GWB1_42_6]KKS70167.1 MAG: 30S ribosomal protein S9 [Parcubacteria group bacterium GW2011_GWA1_42_7]KKS92415.1 MAG: 30S ribosomal protein S9 [Parcubacteria group bacterium GW2011_GWC1_43_12]